MSQKSKQFKWLRADEAQDFESWHLPAVGSPAVVALQQKDPKLVSVVEEELAAEKITITELENIREAARLEGLAAGLEEGRSEGRQQGLNSGRLEGKEQGYKEGFSQGETKVKQLQEMLKGMITELQAPADEVAADLESLLRTMVVNLAEKVVGRELSLAPEILAQTIAKTLKQLPESTGSLKLHINPSDRQYIGDFLSDTDLSIEFCETDEIAAGGFKMQAENTLVTHEVEERFKHVAEQFLTPLSDPALENESEQSS